MTTPTLPNTRGYCICLVCGQRAYVPLRHRKGRPDLAARRILKNRHLQGACHPGEFVYVPKSS